MLCLQAACSEVMAIRAARCYDLKSRTIVLANGTPCSHDNMLAAGGSEEYWKLVYQFCHALADNQTDNTEYALFTAICIFSGKYDTKVCIIFLSYDIFARFHCYITIEGRCRILLEMSLHINICQTLKKHKRNTEKHPVVFVCLGTTINGLKLNSRLVL